MPSKSPQQHRFMEAAAHNPEFAKKAGIPQNVAKEFVAVRSYGTPNRDPLLSSANAYGHKGCGKERSVSPSAASGFCTSQSNGRRAAFTTYLLGEVSVGPDLLPGFPGTPLSSEPAAAPFPEVPEDIPVLAPDLSLAGPDLEPWYPWRTGL